MLLDSLLGQAPTPLPSGDTMWLWFDRLKGSLLDPMPDPLFRDSLDKPDATGSVTASLNLSPIAPLPADISGWHVHFMPAIVAGNFACAGSALEILLR